jgi:hypothetical protein
VLCLIVLPLPPGENPFAIKINNSNNNNNNNNNNNKSFLLLCPKQRNLNFYFQNEPAGREPG